jgi:hypothetical protein
MRKETISFEIWGKKRVIVVRNEKGKFLSRIQQKGSGIKTKEQAYKIYQKNQTLNKKVVRISKKSAETDNSKTDKLIIKGKDKSKTLNLKSKGFRKAKQIGKNTAIIRTKKKFNNEEYYQIVVTVKWGDKQVETIGYSDIKGNKLQAFNRARSGAIARRLIDYDHKISFESETKGVAFKPNNIVYFEMFTEVQTYVNTENKVFESNITQRT